MIGENQFPIAQHSQMKEWSIFATQCGVHEYCPREEADKNLFVRVLTVHFSSESSQSNPDRNSLTDNEESFLSNFVLRKWKIKENHEYSIEISVK